MSGNDEEIFVNGVFSGGFTTLDKFTAYINPYMVVTQGWNYTKHIYIGSQRIVSKLGVAENPEKKGEFATVQERIMDDAVYKAKYKALQGQIKDIYADFDVPYYGTDKGCDTSAAGTANINDSLRYYYHPDHLGSSSLITDIDGDVVQHLEYVPFGEVFLDERNNSWNTPYLFNAKELDEETGLYYYGARYYDPRVSVWYGIDKEWEKFPGRSPYEYCYSNPTKYLDPNGKYGSDGHYWTVLAMSVSMNLPYEQAVKYAVAAEHDDHNRITNSSIQNTTFANDGYPSMLPFGGQEKHGLTGKTHESENKRAHEKIDNGDINYLHLLGDSYAHATESSGYKKMFHSIIGHLFKGKNPDNIGKHSEQYKNYIGDLAETMAGMTGFNGNVDRTVFNLVADNKDVDVRTDILKFFSASKTGQGYKTT
jgi:RHS repeat-associated protein